MTRNTDCPWQIGSCQYIPKDETTRENYKTKIKDEKERKKIKDKKISQTMRQKDRITKQRVKIREKSNVEKKMECWPSACSISLLNI